MSLIILSSDLLLNRLERVAGNHAERNIRLLHALRKMDRTKFGFSYLGKMRLWSDGRLSTTTRQVGWLALTTAWRQLTTPRESRKI